MLRLSFIQEHWRLIAFGFAMTFCSSFGQTHFISWFGGEIRATFSLSHGDFGSIYSIATLSSAATLVWLGRKIDVVSLRAFSLAVVIGLVCACLLMASSWGVLALGVAVFGLRLFGQGLVSHAGLTALGRYFAAERGRVVSIASLGYTAGEAVFARVVVMALVIVDWRTVWVVAAIALALALPGLLTLLKGHEEKYLLEPGNRAGRFSTVNDYAVKQVLRDAGLWLRLPALMAPAFVFTGLIFHQVHMAEAKGWSPSLMAWSFGLSAIASVAASLVAGPLVDWFSSRRFMTVFLVPLIVSCGVLYASDASYAAPLFFVFMGINAGCTSVLLGAVWAEIYGVTHLGAIRSLGHAAMVFSSGLAPAVMGVLIDAGISIEVIALYCAIFSVGASVLAAFALPFRGIGMLDSKAPT